MFETLIDRTKTVLELRHDPVEWNLFYYNASDVMLPRKARTPIKHKSHLYLKPTQVGW